MRVWFTFASNASKTALTGNKKNITTNAIVKTMKKSPILCQLIIFRFSPGTYKEEYDGVEAEFESIVTERSI